MNYQLRFIKAVPPSADFSRLRDWRPGAIYFVADDLLGTVQIDRSLSSSNGFRYAYTPSPGRAENGVFLQTAAANITITNSTFN